MRFNDYSGMEGKHSFLSPSTYHWIRYDDEKLKQRYTTAMAAQRGTELHEFASQAIKLGIKLPKNNKSLNSFVNDAIGYRMASEQMLFYSMNSFGTADAISFRNGLLRIFDLKTGVTKASLDQLRVYAALFCLEYDYAPNDIAYDLRIYQNDEIMSEEIDPRDIMDIMGRIIHFDKLINDLREDV